MKYNFVDCLGRVLNNTKLDDTKTSMYQIGENNKLIFILTINL